MIFIQEMGQFFSRERKTVGLHGLYTKYQCYSPAFAALMSLYGHIYVTNMTNGTELNDVWDVILSMYQPWLTPLGCDDREDAAVWIKELAPPSQMLLPWAPDESRKAAMMCNSFSSVISFICASGTRKYQLSYHSDSFGYIIILFPFFSRFKSLGVCLLILLPVLRQYQRQGLCIRCSSQVSPKTAMEFLHTYSRARG
jgi:hypothetical protein